MAPSSGHLLVPKAMRIIKFAFDKTASVIKSKLPQSSTSNPALQPVRVYAQNQPLHPLAYLKQSRAQNYRWFSTKVRTLASTTKSHPVKYDRSSFPVSKVSRAISQQGATPFASTLRPNLTGGALPRTAGGYGKGTRQFSHTAGCQAQVLHNVNNGIRAFFIGGGKARFDGVDPVTGEKRFRSISQSEDKVYQKWETPASPSIKGTSLDFHLSPTVTALSSALTPKSSQDVDLTNLNTPSLLTTLRSDFARALQDLSLIIADLERLSAFGDLPISYSATPSGPVLSVRFPGCDYDLVSRLCDEVGVRRGLIAEDEGWDKSREVEMALLFPFAPTSKMGALTNEEDMSEYGAEHCFASPLEARREPLNWQEMMSSPSRHDTSIHDEMSFEEATLRSPAFNSHSPSGYESLGESDFASDDPYYPTAPPRSLGKASSSQDYEGLEGIYRFLQVCDDARR